MTTIELTTPIAAPRKLRFSRRFALVAAKVALVLVVLGYAGVAVNDALDWAARRIVEAKAWVIKQNRRSYLTRPD